MRLFAAFLISLCCATFAFAEPHFPALTGRVVDNAHLLSSGIQEVLTKKLEAFEANTTTQVVVVTVPSLDGLEIEEYGYQLGRHWGIGQKGKNNGLLFLIAPAERRVRIEVGYGLEGVMTDAEASRIIQTIILPAFKRDAVQAGIVDGTQAILKVLNGEEHESVQQTEYTNSSSWMPDGIGSYLLMQFVVGMILKIVGAFGAYRNRSYKDGISFLQAHMPRGLPLVLLWLLLPIGLLVAFSRGSTGSSGGGFGGGSSGSSSGGSSFSGGGGSFGGGGSSGKW